MLPSHLQQFLGSLSEQEQQALFQALRQRFTIHQLEADWRISAEFILEAIAKSQDITRRGVRGIIAELCFEYYIINPLQQKGWRNVEIIGDQPYDSLIERSDIGQIKIQTKNQRLERGVPKYANSRLVKSYPHYEGWYICETQKTRTGKDSDGNDTRPYRYGEFDILSVCLQPSTQDWTKFIFCAAHTLIPNTNNPSQIATFQPVPSTAQGDWTFDLEEAIHWHQTRYSYEY